MKRAAAAAAAAATTASSKAVHPTIKLTPISQDPPVELLATASDGGQYNRDTGLPPSCTLCQVINV